ncbi:hypothetical protein [Plantactinospora sp. GCM10030261]|uniref:COG1470 family protein n=1 Tax=Plantactinospora sp. GCM10030261 TaxID=3273420 RepID=UPI00361079AC
MGTHATLEPVPLHVVPGSGEACLLTLRNTGEVVEAYQLDVVGDATPWSRVEPPAVTLYPEAEATVRVVFEPPRSAVVPAGEVPFAVRVIPSERPDQAVAPEGVVVVEPFVETTAELTPRTSRGWRGGRHEVAVDNLGNVPLVAALAGTDPDQRVVVRAQPSTVTVGPGQAAFATIRVRNRRRLWRGQPVTHPFQVVVSSDGQPDLALPGATLQTPFVPPGTGRVLAALAVLALLLTGAWFLALKPAVRSTAEDAVREPLAQVAQQAADADRKAEAASQEMAAESDDVAPTTPVAVPASPAAGTASGGGGTPARIRVQTGVAAAGTATSTPYRVPAGRTLVVTDLVLQNPQGDTGRVDVLVDDDPILTHALANFRDLDFHFVSPITVPAGRTLRIRTTCQTPGVPLPGGTGSQCRTWMLASGVTRAAS